MLRPGSRKIVRREVDAQRLSALPSIPPLLQKIYAARGVDSEEELQLGLPKLLDYSNLKGVAEAVELLKDALTQDKHLLIVGDFDADGATSCALAMKALMAMGAKKVGYLVPNRFDFGYGLTPEIVAVAAQQSPDIIITVDNGISSLAGVTAARQAGIKVIVTDHHLPGAQLPQADAIVNPNQPGCAFQAKNTAGVGVIFYLMTALRAALRESGWFENRGLPLPNMADYLDLVALGTVADVVPLDQNNRILVEQGIRRIRVGKASAGLMALVQVAGKDASRLVAGDLGFAVGPRLNAAGRLEDMSLGIECLLATDAQSALAMAVQLDELNQVRKEIEQEMKGQALEALAHLDIKVNMPAICLFDSGWHQGVIGILASRIKERYHRPVIVFADAGNGEIKGSARSIPGFHIRDALDEVASQYPDLLQKFGGHAMAAGLSIQRADFESFTQAFTQSAQRLIATQDLEATVQTDGALTGEQQSLDIAQLLRSAGPWGQGFAEPLFDGRFDVLDSRVLGRQHLKLVLAGDSKTRPVEAIAFFVDTELLEQTLFRVHIVYKLDINEYRGERRLQLIVEYLEPLASNRK